YYCFLPFFYCFSLILFFFFFQCSPALPDLHSFPTRRSSDLAGRSGSAPPPQIFQGFAVELLVPRDLLIKDCFSFITQRDQRIDMRSTPRGNITSPQSHENKNQRARRIRAYACRTNSVQQATQELH